MKRRVLEHLLIFLFLALSGVMVHCREEKEERMAVQEKKICVCFIGEKDSLVSEFVPSYLDSVFHQRIKVTEVDMDLGFAYDARREQFHSSAILGRLRGIKDKECERLLGIVEVDLYVPELNFVFGEADFKTKVAVISTHRLKEEFYGRPQNEQLFLSRVVKEAVHELGHTFRLPHCPDRKCVMHFSNSLSDTDFKSHTFCRNCRKKLGFSD